jgi:uncharacterized protein
MNTALPPLAQRFDRLPGDLLLWLTAALHLLALASLLLVLALASPAAAAEASACTGTNVLEELRSSKPDVYAKVEAEGDRVPNGKGIFWKIEHPGVAPSYLLGTMHVSDPRVLQMPPAAPAALSAARVVAVESEEVLDENKAMATLMMKPQLMMLPDGKSLSSYLSEPDLRLLQDGLKTRGVSLSAVARMRPWMLMSMVTLPSCETSRKSAGSVFLDKSIATRAAAAGKTVIGLETLEEQAGAINAIPIELQLKALLETLKLGPRSDAIFYTMTELYLSGDIGILQPLLKVVAPDGTADGSADAAFDALVITKRNRLMAERAAPQITQGGAFIAVGAAHLPGADGLVEIFRSLGFGVTPVN